MAATTTKKAGRTLPTARVVKKTPKVKKAGLPSEARRKRVHDRLVGSAFASDKIA